MHLVLPQYLRRFQEYRWLVQGLMAPSGRFCRGELSPSEQAFVGQVGGIVHPEDRSIQVATPSEEPFHPEERVRRHGCGSLGRLGDVEHVQQE